MMPKSLTRISAILKHAPRTAETEQMLREEVGRLNAKIAQLETELQAARRSPDPIFSPALKKQAGTSLGDWKFYAALCAGLWVISGDDLGIQKRLENILLQRDALFGDECPTPELQDLIADNPAIEI
ncbi:MAG: hypothetical protein PF480_01070 [Roseovarius sp.]|jgi:hypothetical protein|nr:hypothetical protein [Roseovarius sp.]